MKPIKSVKIGWGLARVSSKAQAEVQHGSLEQQGHMMKRWAATQSQREGIEYQIIRIVEEDISGRKKSLKKRDGYHEILRAIKTKQIDFVVIEKLDRLGRDKVSNQFFIDTASENEVEIFEVESGRINMKDRGSRLGFNIKNLLAEEYSLDLEEKVTKKVREAKVNNGKDSATIPVLGLEAHPTKIGIYVIDKNEQKVVIDIFETFLKTGSLKETVSYCKKMGYKTKARSTREKIDKKGNRILPRQVGGQDFDSKRLYDHLTNTKYLGHAYFKDTWVQFPNLQDEEGFVKWNYAHGPVIDEELFLKVRTLLEQNKQKSASSKGRTAYLLSGVLYLHDGTPFHGVSAKSGANSYYQDRKKTVRIERFKIEKIVKNRVGQYLKDSDLLKGLFQTALKHRSIGGPVIDSDITRMNQRLNELNGIDKTLSEAIRNVALSGDVAKVIEASKAIADEKAKVEKERESLKAQLQDLQRSKAQISEQRGVKSLQDYIGLALKDFKQKNDHIQKQIIQSLIPKIILHPDQKLELQVNLDCLNLSDCDGRKKVRIPEKWRGRRDSNPRPPA